MTHGLRPTRVAQVVRVLKLLTYGKASWGLRELARSAQLSKSAGHRLLRELLLAGFVRQNGDGKYSVGPGAYAWAAATLSDFEIGKAALPVMRDVVAQCHETVVLTVYDQGALYFVEKVECSNPIRYVPPLGTAQSLHAGAAGKVILAYLPEEELKAHLKTHALDRLTSRTTTTETELRDQLTVVRRQGWALSVGERIPGTAGLAAPIFNSRSRVVGSLDLIMPEHRFHDVNVPRSVKIVKNAAMEVSRQLGSHDGGKAWSEAKASSTNRKASKQRSTSRRVRRGTTVPPYLPTSSK